jgi:hypothetical protein
LQTLKTVYERDLASNNCFLNDSQAVIASISTHAFTYSSLNRDNQQTDDTLVTYPAQDNWVIRVQNLVQRQVHLEQNGSKYVNDVVKNILKCDGKDITPGELIPWILIKRLMLLSITGLHSMNNET